MKKREQGVLSVEASIVLTLMLLFILFLFSFGRVYRAQNIVSHAALQSADAVALESYLRETALQADASDVVYLANQLTGSSAISVAGLESLRSADLPKIARQKFVAAIAGSEAKADQKLRSMGIKDGLAGIDFSECKMDLSSDDVIIAIKYTIEMQFPVFGFEEITVTKAAKAKTFGEILFEVSTKPNNPGWGSTSGDDNVPHGSEVWITATPNYGYKFVSWDDGNTSNPRKVMVTDAQKYVAIFERDSFGINIRKKIEYNQEYKGLNHTDYGSFEGAGNYQYMENAVLTAIPKEPYYQFKGWDLNGDGVIDDTNRSVTVAVDKTYDNIRAVFKPAICTVATAVSNGERGTAHVQQGDKTGISIDVEYGSKVQLTATAKDSVKYIFSKWSNNSTQPSTSVTVEGNTVYEAIFTENTYTVKFYNGNTVVHTTNVIRGSSINGSKAIIASSMPLTPSAPANDGAIFDKWTYNGSAFSENTAVNGNISVYAAWNYTVTLNANGGTVSGVESKSYTVPAGGDFNFSGYTPHKNGFAFNGWYVGNDRYTGNKTINGNIAVTASWICKHKYDDGSTMYEPISIVGAGTGCANSSITYRCKGCSHSYTNTGIGNCNYSGWCGVKHSCNWVNAYCTRGNHNWSQYGCITCIYCGRLENGGYYYGAYRSFACWCINHNGHKYRTIRITGPHG